jgi:positive regulator of sigma E activity
MKGYLRSLLGSPARIYFTNLLLILVAGVFACWWTIFYSDWFDVLGGLLGLGGAFTWLAFISNMLREERVKELYLTSFAGS